MDVNHRSIQQVARNVSDMFLNQRPVELGKFLLNKVVALYQSKSKPHLVEGCVGSLTARSKATTVQIILLLKSHIVFQLTTACLNILVLRCAKINLHSFGLLAKQTDAHTQQSESPAVRRE